MPRVGRVSVVRSRLATGAALAAVAIAACISPRAGGGGRPDGAVEQRRVGDVAAPARGAELTLTVPARVERVTPLLVTLFLENGIPVTSAMGNVVEAQLPREYQWVGRYEITARAYLTPLSGGATSVRMLAEETRDASALGPTSRRVSADSRGRALRVWHGLERVAQRLPLTIAADSSVLAVGRTAGGSVSGNKP